MNALKSSESGQAAVEVVAVAPLVAVLIAALVLALQAHRARDAAAVASHAGALAALVGRDPIAAAREAAPAIDPSRLRVRREGRRITVRVRAEGPRSLVRPFDAEQTVTLPPEVGP
ncbi:MAG: hypothetical protein WC558_15300 [Patulibacter sp.]